MSAQGRLNYRGPLRHKTNYPGLKIDLTADEMVVHSPVKRQILHGYLVLHPESSGKLRRRDPQRQGARWRRCVHRRSSATKHLGGQPRSTCQNFLDGVLDGPLSQEARCYSFEELFAEKLMALTDRARPRDLYDVVELHQQQQYALDSGRIERALARKCEHRAIPQPLLAAANNPEKRERLIQSWATMLRHQLPDLPSAAVYLDALPAVFDKLGLGI